MGLGGSCVQFGWAGPGPGLTWWCTARGKHKHHHHVAHMVSPQDLRLKVKPPVAREEFLLADCGGLCVLYRALTVPSVLRYLLRSQLWARTQSGNFTDHHKSYGDWLLILTEASHCKLSLLSCLSSGSSLNRLNSNWPMQCWRIGKYWSCSGCSVM